ncbi:MAG: PqqD family protein [Solirubrobacteraceae bacterium]
MEPDVWRMCSHGRLQSPEWWREWEHGMVHQLDDRQRSLLRARARVPHHVVYRDFPDETVVLNLQTERYHGLNPTAGRMLAALDGPCTIGDAAAQIAHQLARSPSEVEIDMCDLCAQLLERGLIELDDSA